MAKSGKERSAEFRARKRQSKDESGHEFVQCNLYMSVVHRAVLRQLALRHAVTVERMLAMIISDSHYVQCLEEEKTGFLDGQFSKSCQERADSPTDVSDYHGLQTT